MDYQPLSFWNHNIYKFPAGNKLHSAWTYYLFLAFVPLCYFALKRFFKQLPIEEYFGEKNNNKIIPGEALDKWFKFGLLFPLIYYYCDIIFTFLHGNLNSLPVLLHVLKDLTITFILCLAINMTYIPWFVTFTLTSNLFRVYFLPTCCNSFSKLILFFSFAICFVGLKQEPWKTRKYYKYSSSFLLIYSGLTILEYLI